MPNRISNFSSIRTIIVAIASLSTSIYGHPLISSSETSEEEGPVDYGSAAFWEKMTVVMFLVVIGGAFAGM